MAEQLSSGRDRLREEITVGTPEKIKLRSKGAINA
jgi:hypothetical protein